MIRVAWSGMAGPQLQRNNAWWACMGGLMAYLAWQVYVLATATLVFLGRASDRCLVGPECSLLAGVSDTFVIFLAVGAAAASVAILQPLFRLAKEFWRQKYWTGVALRVVGIVTMIIGLIGFLLYGVVWAAIGAWIAFWSRRLQWAGPRPQPGAPPSDPNVLEGERV